MGEIEEMLIREITIINRTLAAYGVDAGTRPAWTTIAGGSFVVYGLRTGPAQRIADIARLLPELSERLSAARRQRTPVRLREMPLALEVAHPQPRPLDWRRAIMCVGTGRMVAGRNYSVTPAADLVLDLSRSPHVLVAGTTGSGKSTMLRMMLASLAYSSAPESLRLVLIDRKNEDLVPFARLPHTELAAYTAEDAQRAVAIVHADLQRRVQAGTKDWHRLVLVIDELAQLEQATLDLLSAILAIGRSKRVNVIAATQHPTVRLIGDKANYAVRLAGQVTDAATAALATGRRGTGAELLPGAGAFLYVDGGRLERVQAYNLTADAAAALVSVIGQKWGSVQLPVVEPATTVEGQRAEAEDEITRIAGLIRHLWEQGASKSAMCRAALDRPYAGGHAAKIDRALARLEAERSTTTTVADDGAGAVVRQGGSQAGSSRALPAPILRLEKRA